MYSFIINEYIIISFIIIIIKYTATIINKKVYIFIIFSTIYKRILINNEMIFIELIIIVNTLAIARFGDNDNDSNIIYIKYMWIINLRGFAVG